MSKIKTVSSEYIVYINNHPVKIFNNGRSSRTNFSLAKNYVANIKIDDTIDTVKIVKQVLSEKILRTYKPQVKKILTIDQLFDSEEQDESDIAE
jgi:hypothetical protein